MPLESATYISQLSATDPNGSTDQVATLDDHIRLLKQVLQNTINLDGKVDAGVADLNTLAGAAAAGLTAADLLVLVGAAVAGLTNTELQTLVGASSNIQTQLDGKEPAFAKNTAFNKDFGTTAGTVAEGDHTHSQYITAADYATSTTGGTLKARLSGTTLYLRNDGTDA